MSERERGKSEKNDVWMEEKKNKRGRDYLTGIESGKTNKISINILFGCNIIKF